MNFLPDAEALVIKDCLVIADLHIGMELCTGHRIPPQTDRMIKKTNALLEKTKKRKLVILGDLKHQIPRTPFRELREVRRYFESVKGSAKIILVKGNHDGGIEGILPECEVVSELLVSNTLLIHGHRKPKGEFEKIIMAHNHPMVEFRDRFGGVLREKAWIAGKLGEKEVTMMPAFNDMIGGTPVQECRLGPIASRMKGREAYLLDGTFLGPVNSLGKVFKKSRS
jgi:putative SbcD/Mre11-related phosphoesterase